MNKNDIKLIIIVVILILLIAMIFILTNKESDTALVYYDNELLMKIDLKINKVYTVTGDNGEVIIEVMNKKIKVNQENSPYHLCSKQGYISSSNETIVCLPNKIVIKIAGDSEIDTEVK